LVKKQAFVGPLDRKSFPFAAIVYSYFFARGWITAFSERKLSLAS
jgi:hypothetical protein